MMDLKQITKNRPLVISIGLAIVAVILVQMFLKQREAMIRDRLEKMSKQITDVFKAKEAISVGEVIKSDMVKTEKIPVRYLQPKAATSWDQIEDRIVAAPIEKDEQILLTKLVYGTSAELAAMTPPGKRAITILVDNIAGLGGMVKPGDYVDVISALPQITPDGKLIGVNTVTVFQNVKVLAVGGKTGFSVSSGKRGSEEKTLSPNITLALSPEEANIAAFLSEQQGVKLRLALRSPADARVTPETLPPADWSTIMQYLYPGWQPPMQEEIKETTIEIRRGTQTEEVTVAQ